MIISMHTPKAGGSSFKEILEKNYGRYFIGDYNDFPINKSFEERTQDAINFDQKMTLLKRKIYLLRGTKCIHGHFLPFKYRSFLNDKNTTFVTWLREPTERLISHYYYWKRACNKNSASLHKKVVKENWSLQKFCLSNEMQNIYGKYLWEFPIQNFDFIGITEYFEDDVSFFFRKYLDTKVLDIAKANVNPDLHGKYSERIDKELLSEIKSFHSEDYKIYDFAIDKRNKRESIA